MTDHTELRRLAEDHKASDNKNPMMIHGEVLIELLDEVERLREALERLGSMEAMTIPFALAGKRSLEAAELVARIDFARAALTKEGE